MAIIVKIQGGLGNQLFQFAFGESLGRQLQQVVLYDLTSYNCRSRKIGLNQFNINLSSASDKIIDQFFTFKNRVLNKYLYNSNLNTKLVHFENQKIYYNVPVNLNGNSYYSGYWQSEKYFSQFQAHLRVQLTLKVSLKICSLLSIVKQSNTVAIHFRRGDYLEPHVLKLHGLLGLKYYLQAIKLMLSKIPDALFVVFSNDPLWVESQLVLPCNWIHADLNKVYTDEETLIVMSLCKHQIIANSTYSWWAAWLNTNPNKEVIAPKNWFVNSIENQSPILNTWLAT